VRKFADAALALYKRRLFEEEGVRGQSGAERCWWFSG